MQSLANATILALTACVFAGTPALAQDTQPNILLVLFDDVGFMDFGAYGSDTRTPTIDELAQSGIMFSRYYSSPFCGPSRAMLMTGMDNHQVGMGTVSYTHLTLPTIVRECRSRGGPGH